MHLVGKESEVFNFEKMLSMTMQRQDTLFYKGEGNIIFSQPLEKYFELNTRPNFRSLDSSLFIRGYFADWKIENEKLFLIDFTGYQIGSNWAEYVYGLNDLFKGVDQPVFAEWFSGDILIPYGGNINSNTYSQFKIFSKLSFNKGKLNTQIEVNAQDLIATNIGLIFMLADE